MYQPPGNRYQIEREIARGGVGVLYLATDRNLNRVVALKRLRREDSSGSQETEEKLVNEARALSTLQHPNVVTVYDVGVDKGGVYVVMEYVRGESLDQAVTRQALTLDDFKILIEHSLNGLHAAHQEGLIHRDIKPANLMLDWKEKDRYTVKMVDFGLARFMDMPTVQTVSQADSVMGTIYFMAPEQFEQKTADVRSDLYSLGCVFYHALTQAYPFEGESPAQVMAAHLSNRFERLGPRRPDIPHNVLVWVESLLALDPKDRPASAREALDSFPERAFVPHWVEIPSNVKPLTKPSNENAPVERIPTRKNTKATTKDLISSSNPVQPSLAPLIAMGVGLILLLLTGIGVGFYIDAKTLEDNEQAALDELQKTLGTVVAEHKELMSQAIY